MKNFPFSILTLKELYTFGIRVINAVLVPLAENVYVQSLCTSLKNANTNLEKAMGRALTSEFTPLLIEKDKIRDDVFIGLRNFVSSFVRSQNSAKKQAALYLWNIFENIGLTIYRHAYAIETADINSLITYLKEPQATAALVTLGGTEWLDQLIAAQNDFEAVHKDKVDTESAINYTLALESKATITHYLGALINFVGTNSEYEKAAFNPLKLQIDTISAEVLAQARTRITLEAKNKEAETNKNSV